MRRFGRLRGLQASSRNSSRNYDGDNGGGVDGFAPRRAAQTCSSQARSSALGENVGGGGGDDGGGGGGGVSPGGYDCRQVSARRQGGG